MTDPDSALDRPLLITIFKDARAQDKTDTTRSLRELARLIPKRRAERKAELRLLKLASFGERRTAKGAIRNNANLLTLEGVEGDYDGELLSVAHAAKRLQEADIAALIYTSPSHRPDAPRWRVLCPTSRPLPPSKRDNLMARVMGALDGELSPESFSLSQSYYYGYARRIRDKGTKEWRDGEPVTTALVEGRAIDLADDLDADALDKNGNPWSTETVELDDGDDDFELDREPDVERIEDALESIPAERWDENYHEWLAIGQALHHEFGGGAEGLALWDKTSQRCSTYDTNELASTWNSFGSYSGRPVTIGTLYRLAKQQAKAATFGGLTFLTPAECRARPRRASIVKELLAHGDVTSIFGAPGAGKSALAPYLGYQVALGEPVFGMRTKPGLVLYVAVEAFDNLCERVDALERRQGDTRNFRVVGGVSDLFDEASPDLEALLDVVREQRPALIFIDTLFAAFPGLEENDAKGMGRVVMVARQLAEHGAAVVLIHHDTKAEGSTPRGHSALNGALDMALQVKRDIDGVVRGRLTKNRNGSPKRDIAFRISSEELGVDEDGDVVTAPIVEEMNASAHPDRVRLTGPEAAALAKLIDMESDGCVAEDDWRAACVGERQVSGSEDAESRKRAMRRAVQGLAKKGLIDTQNGVVSSHHEVTSDEDE